MQPFTTKRRISLPLTQSNTVRFLNFEEIYTPVSSEISDFTPSPLAQSINPLSTSKKCAFCTSGVKLTPVGILTQELFSFYFFNFCLLSS